MTDEQIRILAWISGLDLEDAQRIQKPLSIFLKGFRRVKKTSPNVCRLSPCQKHQYARGVCARHYQQLKTIHKVVGWAPLAALGLCKTSNLRDLAIWNATLRKKAKLQVPKSQLSLPERKLLGINDEDLPSNDNSAPEAAE